MEFNHHCNSCGAEIQENQFLCPECGAPIVWRLKQENQQSKVSIQKVILVVLYVLIVIATAILIGIILHMNQTKKNDESKAEAIIDCMSFDYGSSMPVASDLVFSPDTCV